MKSIDSGIKTDIQLQISFPKSSEDHRLQLISINGSIFAIVHSPLESFGPIQLLCESWSLVLLAPIKSRTNILISATNIIILNEIVSEEGHINVHASNRLVKFSQFSPLEKVSEMGEKGLFQFEDDPGAFLYFYRLFEGIITAVRGVGANASSEAQQHFIMSLCTLADKIEGKSSNLDMHKVLNLWNIPLLKSKRVFTN